MTSREEFDTSELRSSRDAIPRGALGTGTARFAFLIVLAIAVYYAVMFGAHTLIRLAPTLNGWIDVAFGSGVRPNLLVILLPVLTASATLGCMTLEVIAGGWKSSTLRAAIVCDSASVRTDIFYFLLRISGGTALLALLFSVGTFYVTTSTLNRSLGFHVLDRLQFWPASFLLLLLINSLIFYFSHRLMHTRWLWEIHKVHHSAVDYNVLLPYRNHPIEYWIATIFSVASGALLGGRSEEILAWLVLNTVYQSMVHSKVDWPWRWLEWVLITPGAHRVHHSNAPEHFNRNFGTLSIWDRLFGTYHPPELGVRIGVPDANNFNNNRYAGEIFSVVVRWMKSL